MRYLEMLLSIGYGGGGVQWEEGTRGSCGCSAWVGLSELMSAFMGTWVPIMGDTAETRGAAVSFIRRLLRFAQCLGETWWWGFGGGKGVQGPHREHILYFRAHYCHRGEGSGPLQPALTCWWGVCDRPYLDKRSKRKSEQRTVSQASGHAGRGERVSLLGVHELADGGQLVDLSVGRGAGAIGGLRRHRRPGEG